MPFHKGISNLKSQISNVQLIIRNWKLDIRNWKFSRKAQAGFSLVEVLILIVIIFAMILILLTGATTLKKSYSTNLSGIGAKIASCEIEALRSLAFTNPVFTTYTAQPIMCSADLSKLPASTATRTISNYGGDANIKQITIDVSWTGDSVQFVTLKSKYGI